MRVDPPTLDAWAARLGDQADPAITAERPLLAVSGGPDSVALLLLLSALRPGRLAAATVDHGLRPEAADEAALVARLCAERGVPHATLRPAASLLRPLTSGTVPSPDPLPSTRTSLQARARAARYDLLVDHARATGCDVLLTAHHRDDQAETFLMRASRGSGVDGLAGVRQATTWRGLPVFRPLLGWERRHLADVLRAAGVTAATDPSNADPAFDRTRYRALLAATPELKIDGLARSAAAAAEAAAALHWTVAMIAKARIEQEDDALLVNAADLPRELQRRILALAIARLGERPPRGAALDGAMRSLLDGTQTSLGQLLLHPHPDGRWALRPAPPRRTG